MNVLSLFDGMSCGRMALQNCGFDKINYYASEIDSFATKVSANNYSDINRLGDVTKVKSDSLPTIDLLIGGSPCQGFSFAGKGLNFDDARSKLFFEYIRLLNECKPKYFLLENVKMKSESENVISEYLGVKPIMINSALVSAHDRKRLYWTNIPNVTQPIDKNILLRDILEEAPLGSSLYIKPNIANRYYNLPHKQTPNKSTVIGKLSNYQGDRVFNTDGKASSLSASGGNNGGGSCNIIFDPITQQLRRLSVNECKKLQTIPTEIKLPINNSSYKILGNGWTVDVIAHILNSIND